nr:cytochrome P450 78A9-like [Ipomoea batatas]
METITTENLGVSIIISKCMLLLSSQQIFLFVFLGWVAMVLLYWAYPGGPAWGMFYIKARCGKGHKTIPGPRGAPVVGSMSLMAGLAHRKLAAVAQAKGAKRLMAFSLGETRVIVTCNPHVAKEILNSSAFADRPVKESAYGLMFDRAMGFAPYGVYWRTLRKIADNHLFSQRQIRASETPRREISDQMVSAIANFDGGEFRVRDILKLASLNSMMCLVFGRKYDEVEELIELVQEGYGILAQLNLSDHLPWLASFDVQKVRRRCSELVPKVNRLVSHIIWEHRARKFSGEESHDFVDVLLSLNAPHKLSNSDMVSVLWEMIFRGTDTVAVLIEWILARLVLHREIQTKLQEELDGVVGKLGTVTESDVSSLPYLHAVVKEVLRLHPPGPLLSWARLAVSDTTVDGYHVPAGTTAMVNMWTITRDPDIWADPLRFMPDRFMKTRAEEVSVMGSDLRLAPFGSGRRSCPGKTLGLTTVVFWVASLLQEFDWVGSDEKPVDLSEVLNLSCEMAKPLTVTALPRRRTIHK